MTTTTLEERQRHIAEIKKSFNNPAYSSKYMDIGSFEQAEEEGKGGTFKIKALVAILLFAAFVAFDHYHVTFYDKNVDFIYSTIENEQIPVEAWVQTMEKLLP